MFDIDNFKNVNDTYGHIFGDHVLCEIVKLSKNIIRASDGLFRYGGEEFIVLLPDSDLDAAIVTAQKLRQAVEEYDFGKGSHITASYGVTNYNLMHDINTNINNVDTYLYEAKNSGRNCVKSDNLK